MRNPAISFDMLIIIKFVKSQNIEICGLRFVGEQKKEFLLWSVPQNQRTAPFNICDFTNFIIIKMSNESAGFSHSLYLLYMPVKASL